MSLFQGGPTGIFRADQRYGAQVHMCHFGLVRSGIPRPSNFRTTRVAVATLRPLLPLVAQLNEYRNVNAPPWFTWCSIHIVCPQGSDAIGVLAPLCDGAPMAMIAFVGSFKGGGGLGREWWATESLPQGQKAVHPCA